MTRFKNLKNNSIVSHKSHKATLFLLLVISGLFFISAYCARLYIKNYTPAVLSIQEISRSTQVSAFVGEFRFTLTGYTSPFARVVLEGQGIFDETVADAYGRFTFLNKFSPLSPREACITAYDTDGRSSKPVCLPPFSVNKNVVIGPILLPPTLSVNQDSFIMNDYGILTGKAAPESLVSIDLYTDRAANKINLTTLSDGSGDYSLTLPTERQATLRMFTQNAHKELSSDTSNTLVLHILPIWKLIMKHLALLMKFLLRYWLPVALFIEGLILLVLWLLGKRSVYPLALRPHNELTVTSTHSLVKQAR